jgi:hypothetical protein
MLYPIQLILPPSCPGGTGRGRGQAAAVRGGAQRSYPSALYGNHIILLQCMCGAVPDAGRGWAACETFIAFGGECIRVTGRLRMRAAAAL